MSEKTTDGICVTSLVQKSAPTSRSSVETRNLQTQSFLRRRFTTKFVVFSSRFAHRSI